MLADGSMPRLLQIEAEAVPFVFRFSLKAGAKFLFAVGPDGEPSAWIVRNALDSRWIAEADSLVQVHRLTETPPTNTALAFDRKQAPYGVHLRVVYESSLPWVSYFPGNAVPPVIEAFSAGLVELGDEIVHSQTAREFSGADVRRFFTMT